MIPKCRLIFVAISLGRLLEEMTVFMCREFLRSMPSIETEATFVI